MASTSQREAPGKIAGHVYSKSDVETIEDRPIQVLVAAVSPAKFDSLLRELDASEEPTGGIVNLGKSVEGDFEKYASGYDVSGSDGRYQIQVSGSGVRYLCLTGETKVPKKESWSIVGCMKVTVPEEDTVEQDLYVQFGSLVSP